MITSRQRLALTTFGLLVCCMHAQSEESQKNLYQQGIIHAINLGGPEHHGEEGVMYQADTLATDAQAGKIDYVRSTQDPDLFRTYREGNMHIQLPVERGTYAITLKFAEPHDIAVGQRIFNVSTEDRVQIQALDVRLARDGNMRAALEHTIPAVEVTDGILDLSLNGITGVPILNALIVRKLPIGDGAWDLVWQDEFNYDGKPDPGKWQFDQWPARKVNDEDQAYTSRPRNARVENGNLIIEAHKEKYGNAHYTSARLHTLGKADVLYGRIEVRAKLPAGQGTWAAIWMLPSDPFKYATNCKAGTDWQGSANCDAWPNSGEIDIMEHVGYDMQKVHGTVHTKAYYWVNGEQRKASIDGVNVDTAFHTYALEWAPDHMVVSFDGIPYFYYHNQQEGWQGWPFDHPYHLILNLAIGGSWGRAGGPIDDTIFPVKMEVDYVRIFEPAKPSLDN